jgi:hypothetical protein
VLTLTGLAIAGASIVGIDWALYHLIRTGTCASGGPYVSARPCPAGTGTQILVLVGGIFGALIGPGLYLARGGGGRPSRVGIGTIMWALLFLTMAASGAVGAFGPAATGGSGAKLGAVIIAAIFVPMGLAPLLAVAFAGRRGEHAGESSLLGTSNPMSFGPTPPVAATAAAAPRATRPPGPAAPSGGDALSRIERLGELRAKGVITEAEFEEHKRRMLDEV